MSTIDELDPPRKSGETAHYEEDPFGLGDIDLEVVEDFLPPPEQFTVAESATEEITIALTKDSIDFFQQKEKELGAPYHRIIRDVLDRYVQAQQKIESGMK